MVSIGRALLAQPRCLIMDEPSIGLAPKLFQDLMAPIRALQRERGMSILLVEQNVREALKVSDRVVVMKAGRMVREALPAELADNAASDGTVLTGLPSGISRRCSRRAARPPSPAAPASGSCRRWAH